MTDTQTLETAIAIIGMAGRVPGAETLETFWHNVQSGVEAVTFFSAEELEQAGVEPALLRDPRYVRAGAVLSKIDQFDAAFFGITQREAELTDPQHRVFLETAWQAFEHAGYDPGAYAGRVGVYAGSSISTYLLNLYTHPSLLATVGAAAILHGNDKDYLATRVSYKLNLRGPSITVQTACSTSLVAVHVACQSLLSGECDMALAGGVSIDANQGTGYLYVEGGILSPDGHCRPFDAQAQGTIFGSGVGVVLLKRLADARADGDHIHAIIRGSALNNDGAGKVGYTAPSLEAQADVIAEALAVAGVEPQTIGYVEAHGTGTPLGDPIELAALNKALQARTDQTAFCAIGSVKSNIGHLNAAAGIVGLIKTTLALQQRVLPPSLHFTAGNPHIDFARGAVYVNSAPRPWEPGPEPRRAGVSSFGIGGTNAHVILEEAPAREPAGPTRPWQLLSISAQSPAALDVAADNLLAHVRAHPEQPLADIAYTLHVGRRHFKYRRVIVGQSPEDLARQHVEGSSTPHFSAAAGSAPGSVAFLFPGQGVQHASMALELYESEEVFRKHLDRCCELLHPLLQLDLRSVLYPAPDAVARADAQLSQTWLTQPALFAVEYALARQWMSWGVRPQAMIGHSLGEYVAACLAGVFSLADALTLVAARGRLMQQMPAGAMLSVALSQEALLPLLGADLSLAAVNSPTHCVVSGPEQPIEALARELELRQTPCRRLKTSHAYHSALMDGAAAAFADVVAQVTLSPPRIPYLSNVSGNWITPAEATSPSYWISHLRQTVRFGDGLRALLDQTEHLLLEVGPGSTLATFARQAQVRAAQRPILTTLGHPQAPGSALETTLLAAGKLWAHGVPVDWGSFYDKQQRMRVPLPTYPFERKRYWIAPARQLGVAVPEAQKAELTAAEHRPAAVERQPRGVLPQPVARVAALFEALLGAPEVGADDNFFELGGDSLLATQLLQQLNTQFQAQVPLRRLFETPTPAGLAQAVEALAHGEVLAADGNNLDLRAEAVLADEIRPEPGKRPRPGAAQRIFLTGGTGFLGAFLLHELLDQTTATIYCLVRADTPDLGRERLRQALQRYALWTPAVEERVIPIPGDLARPLLGLEAPAFERLAAELDCIYHNGALVNFITPYAQLKAANVLGTHEVLRLAALGGGIVCHHISSIGVLGAGQAAGPHVFYEEDRGTPEALQTGYAQSKWVAEQLVLEAQRRGLPVAIYRPGNIVGDSRSGKQHTDDFVFRTIKGWIQLGAAPDIEYAIDLTPVDYVSQAIVALSRQPASLGQVFHVVNPRPARLSTLLRWLDGFGYRLSPVPTAQWQATIVSALERAPDNALYPLLPLIAGGPPAESPQRQAAEGMVTFDCRRTLAGLAATAIRCPVVDEKLLERYLSALIQSGFLPAPEGAVAGGGSR